jgi:hypothetical protein
MQPPHLHTCKFPMLHFSVFFNFQVLYTYTKAKVLDTEKILNLTLQLNIKKGG